MNTRPERGIVLTTAELASEGVEPAIDAIAATGANAITTTTSIVVEAAGESDLREPPFDVAGDARLLDRPLWGKPAVWVERYVAHPPDPSLWRDLPWAPPPVAPEGARVDYARQAIAAARARDMRVYAHFAPYALPGGTGGLEGMPSYNELRHEFRPTRFIGGAHTDGVAYTGCLNNPIVRAYGRARMRELLRHYGDVDGLALDWVEYPVYFIDKLFTCFCEHCQRQAAASGYDWEHIRAAVRVLWDSLHTITPEGAHNLARSGDWGDVVTDPAAMLNGFAGWLDFKAETVALAIDDLRAVMAEEGAGEILLATSEFALPWGRMTGSAHAQSTRGVTSQRVKLYSFHWLMMVRWWTETVLSWNRGSAITPDEATRAILALFGLSLETSPEKLSPEQFGMPAPDQRHNLTPDSYTHRLENALERRGTEAPLMPLLHAYRPAAELAELLETLRPFSDQGIWINRYGYLSDEKLAVLREAWSRPA